MAREERRKDRVDEKNQEKKNLGSKKIVLISVSILTLTAFILILIYYNRNSEIDRAVDRSEIVLNFDAYNSYQDCMHTFIKNQLLSESDIRVKNMLERFKKDLSDIDLLVNSGSNHSDVNKISSLQTKISTVTEDIRIGFENADMPSPNCTSPKLTLHKQN